MLKMNMQSKALLGIISLWATIEILRQYSYIKESRNVLHGDLDVILEVELKSEKKIILFGSKWRNRPSYPYLKETQRMCSKCVFTEDWKFFNMSDAVVFDSLTIPIPPPNDRRQIGQVWVWFIMEPPSHFQNFHINRILHYKNLINWTMTYRTDSDAVMPYGRVNSNMEMPRPDFKQTWAFAPEENNELHLKTPTLDELKGRKLIAWISSNCYAQLSRRIELVTQLQKYVPVDAYGKCGNFSCKLKNQNGMNCRTSISKMYKFYLVFESNICEDYVSEKFYDTMLTQMIPVVYGGGHYKKLAPNGSYIDVADFNTVKELADYLKYLDKNHTEFLKYFEWKKFFWSQNNGFVIGFCNLCDKLQVQGIKTKSKSYGNLKDWWYRVGEYKNSKGPACYNPNPKVFEENDAFNFLKKRQMTQDGVE